MKDDPTITPNLRGARPKPKSITQSWHVRPGWNEFANSIQIGLNKRAVKPHVCGRHVVLYHVLFIEQNSTNKTVQSGKSLTGRQDMVQDMECCDCKLIRDLPSQEQCTGEGRQKMHVRM